MKVSDAISQRRSIKKFAQRAVTREENPEVRAALESPALREIVWKATEDQYRNRRWAFARQVVILFVRHRHARRLAWALKRHGVVRELRRKPLIRQAEG